MTCTFISAPRLFDGHAWHSDTGLLVRDGFITALVNPGNVPEDAERIVLSDGMLVPGFVDLQVNGGGGVQFNSDTSQEAIATICAAHRAFGTTGLLVTLITDTPEVTRDALAAGRAAAEAQVEGFLGLHMEGPHLSVARKGTHDPALIRPMREADLAVLVEARTHLPVLLTTIAPESVNPGQISALAAAGLIVSLGHSDCSYDAAMSAFSAGATMATHLHNAMSPLTSREPGLVGAALDTPAVWAGLIADGIHVHPATLRLSHRVKAGPGRLFLVTDAMAATGSDLTQISLNGRAIFRSNGALRLADGTLAGADLTMIDAVRFMHESVGLELDEALRMASLYPARAIGQDARYGHLRPGARADMVHLSPALAVESAWISGRAAASSFPSP